MKTANDINPVDVHRIIEMAWEDRTPFDAIEHQFGIPEKETIRLMRSHLKPSSFKLWRKRVNEGVSLKHREKEIRKSIDLKAECRNEFPDRFSKYSRKS